MERAKMTSNVRSRWSLMLLAAAGLLVTAVACGSGDDNASPSTPVITTGGSGGKSGSAGSAGSTSTGGTNTGSGGTNSTGGKSGTAGSTSTGGTGGSSVIGAGGEGGEAGANTGGKTCPTTDEGFLNQPTTSQSSKFDNDARLGAHATLPALN